MAKSNLRIKDKTFNFGLAADFSDSENEEKNLDFYPTEREQVATSENEEEEVQLSAKPRVNPFASRKSNHEIQPSKISQMRR